MPHSTPASTPSTPSPRKASHVVGKEKGKPIISCVTAQQHKSLKLEHPVSARLFLGLYDVFQTRIKSMQRRHSRSVQARSKQHHAPSLHRNTFIPHSSTHQTAYVPGYCRLVCSPAKKSRGHLEPGCHTIHSENQPNSQPNELTGVTGSAIMS